MLLVGKMPEEMPPALEVLSQVGSGGWGSLSTRSWIIPPFFCSSSSCLLIRAYWPTFLTWGCLLHWEDACLTATKPG